MLRCKAGHGYERAGNGRGRVQPCMCVSRIGGANARLIGSRPSVGRKQLALSVAGSTEASHAESRSQVGARMQW